MDYHVVSIMLDDGTRIEDVAIINASIVGEIRNQPNCTFDPEKIIKITTVATVLARCEFNLRSV